MRSAWASEIVACLRGAVAILLGDEEQSPQYLFIHHSACCTASGEEQSNGTEGEIRLCCCSWARPEPPLPRRVRSCVRGQAGERLLTSGALGFAALCGGEGPAKLSGSLSRLLPTPGHRPLHATGASGCAGHCWIHLTGLCK